MQEQVSTDYADFDPCNLRNLWIPAPRFGRRELATFA